MEVDELSGSAIRQIIAEVGLLGYRTSFSVVDAADYGAPQHRLRFVMIGAREGGTPEMIAPTHGERPGLQIFRSIRDAIFDLQAHPGAHSEYTEDVAKYFRLVPPGGNWRSLPKELQREALGKASFEAGGGKTGFFRRLSWDAPAPTITGRANRKGSALCHPEAIRPLSVRECARLQGFPDDWEFTGAMNRQYMQVGNSVPVQLGFAIGRTLLDPLARRVDGLRSEDVDLALDKAVKRLRGTARNKRLKKGSSHPTLF